MDDKGKILEKYRRMIEELKQRRRRIVILGIMPRTDVSSVIDDKRLEINAALSRLCRAEEVEYLDVEFSTRSGFLSRDRLHLNRFGSDWLARRVYQVSKASFLSKFLN